MALKLPKSSGGDFELAPADTHVATCYRIVDLGTQRVESQDGVKFQHKIMISWELDTKMTDDKPFAMHKRYTLSMHAKASLKKDLESWRGIPFTKEDEDRFLLSALLGKSCMMGIVHTANNGKTYANISSIMKLPKGMVSPTLVNKMVEFDLNDFNQDVFNGFSESLRKTIALSPEYAQAVGTDHTGDDVIGHLDDAPHDDEGIAF